MSRRNIKQNDNIDFPIYFNNTYNMKPYHMFSANLKKLFGANVYKPAVDAGFTCPNRDGTKSNEGCIYCNNVSFSPITIINNKSITKQVNDAIKFFKKRYKSNKFLVYFQPYSNTYADVSYLRKVYYEALSIDGVLGIAIGTRADCINGAKLDLIEEIANKYYVWLELGLQTIHNKTLKLINRCDTYENFLKMYKKIKLRKNINICVHLIHGLPQETKKQMLESVSAMALLHVDGIKFHQLHVVKDTKLEEMYNNNQITLPSLEIYLEILAESLSILPKEVIIHRLFGLSNQDYLVAPKWNIKKEKLTSIVDEYLLKNNIYQGKNYKTI